jgi:hypothetical protein
MLSMATDWLAALNGDTIAECVGAEVEALRLAQRMYCRI